jgi:hypothetical protein
MNINPQFVEITKLIAVLAAVIIGYILTSIANNCLVNGEKFEFSILIKGICKTLTACLSLIIVAYVCTIIDLSSLGFQPQTAITSGILVYSAKLIRNAMGLLGLNKEGKEDKDNIDPLSKIKKEEINNVESIDNDFEQVEIPNDDKQDDNSIAVG